MSNSAEPLTLIKIDLDQCPLTNGVAPCSATTPCTNTSAGCTSPCDYECSTTCIWLSNCQVPFHLFPGRIHATLTDIDISATRVRFGEGLPSVGTSTFCFTTTKRKDDELEGYELSRIFAAQKYIEGRRVTVYSGTCDLPALEYFNTQQLYIESLEGPSGPDKEFCLTARNPLSLTKGATCPRKGDLFQPGLSLGSPGAEPLALGVNLDGVATKSEPDADPYALIGSWLLTNNYPAGDPDVDAAWLRKKHICIDGEYFEIRPGINTDTSPSGWNFKLVDRGACNTAIAPHEQGAAIRCATTFDQMHVKDAICLLLTECADMEAVFINCCDDEPIRVIDYANFEKFCCDNPEMMLFDIVNCEYEQVEDFLAELSRTFFLGIYYDAVAGSIRLADPRPDPSRPVHVITDNDYEDGTLDCTPSEERFSRVLYRYNPIDWNDSPRDLNLSSEAEQGRVDSYLPTCSRREYASVRTDVIETRWITDKTAYLAFAMGARRLRSRHCPAKEICMTMTTAKAGRYRIGDGAQFQLDCLRDGFGDYISDRFIVTGTKPVEWGRCVRVYFEQTPFDGDEALCLSCDYEFPEPAAEPCAQECLDVY